MTSYDALELIEQYDKLIWKLIRKFNFETVVTTQEDLYQAVCEDIVKQAPHMPKTEELDSLKAFMGTLIWRSIIKEITTMQWGGRYINSKGHLSRKDRNRSDDVKRDDRKLTHHGNITEIYFLGSQEDGYDEVNNMDLQESILRNLDELPLKGNQREILSMRLLGMSELEIAEQLDISRQAVNATIRQLRERPWIRAYFEKYLDVCL